MTEATSREDVVAPEDSRQFTLLLDLVREVHHGAGRERVFTLVADTLRQVFGIDRFALVLVDADRLRLALSLGLSPAYLAQVEDSIDVSAGARSLAARQPLYIPDATEDREFSPLQEAARTEGFRTVLILPLFAGAEPLGYLIMYHDALRLYTAAEIMLAQTLAQQAAFAVQHARLTSETEAQRAELEDAFQRRVSESQTIDDIVLAISSSLDLESTLQAITDAAASLSGATLASMYLRGSDGLYRVRAAYGIELARLQPVVLQATDGMLAQLTRTGRPMQLQGLTENLHSTNEARAVVEQVRMHVALGVPFLWGTECIGALYVSSARDDPFPPEAVSILQRLASFAGVAVRNASRFSTLEAERSRLELERERSRSHLLAQLLDLSAQLNSDLSVPALIERVVDAAMALIGARSGTLGLIEGQKLVFRRFHVASGWVDFDVAVSRGEGAPGHAWQTGEPYVSNDCTQDSIVLRTVQEAMKFHRLVIVPVVDRSGAILGTLNVYDPEDERDFDRPDVEALQLLANQAAIAIENARLNETKDAFLSIVSHELKTPVTSIKGFTQVLQRRLSPDSQLAAGRYLEVINQQADRLTGLINDLLDLSRIQTGRFRFEAGPFDYSQLVREVVEEMQLLHPSNAIELEAPEGISALGNANRLRQVLVNLIDNGVQHGPPQGSIRVTVQQWDDILATHVRDSGSGLSLDEADRIFGPYYQVRSGTNQPVKGLGLGLYISRQIVETHGGRIWLDPEDRTTFCFTIPSVDSADGME